VKLVTTLITGLLASAAMLTTADGSATEAPYCGEQGVWIQMLGSGGPELDDNRSAASYLVWLDERAILLVDPGPGSSLRFDEAGARFIDLDAVVFTSTQVDRTVDFPSFIAGSEQAGRTRPLPVLGPDGNASQLSTKELVERLIGPEGAYSILSKYLTFRNPGSYKITVRNIPAAGQRRWSKFGSKDLKLSSVPVHQSDIPSIAWRAEIAGLSIVFTGNFNNQKDVIAHFAKDVDALVVHFAIPENARGKARERHVVPSQIGRIAARANARMVILGYRTSRTLGRESTNRKVLDEHYAGPIVFANELECWGL
jgi:ribonuclease BN (tRNA processing enzyme)